MEMCGIEEENIRKTRIVETQRCFESIEMISRGRNHAHRYFEFGIYAPNYRLPKNPFVPLDKQRQEDLGLKMIFRFFFPQETIPKLYEMRCPIFVDWACLFTEMSDEMLIYAAGDAATGLRALK